MEAEKEKLGVLLEHWIEHNKEHAEEFQKWADKAKGSGEGNVGDAISKAAEQLEKANELLLKALQTLTAGKS